MAGYNNEKIKSYEETTLATLVVSSFFLFPNARNEKPTTILTKIYFSEVKKALTSNSQVRCFFFGAFEPTNDLALRWLR